jgi:hypothetical protein
MHRAFRDVAGAGIELGSWTFGLRLPGAAALPADAVQGPIAGGATSDAPLLGQTADQGEAVVTPPTGSLTVRRDRRRR